MSWSRRIFLVIGALSVPSIAAAACGTSTLEQLVAEQLGQITQAETAEPLCGAGLTHCATIEGSEGKREVCCGGMSDCDAANKRCVRSEQRCAAGAYGCGTSCCLASQRCQESTSTCISDHCPDGNAECPNADGGFGCCAAGEQCNMAPGATAGSCIKPPDESRCKQPQFACVSDTNNPNAPFPETVCCNSGQTCVNVGSRAGCCLPGFQGTPEGTCVGIGPTCDSGDRCPVGRTCCDTDQDGNTDACVHDDGLGNTCDRYQPVNGGVAKPPAGSGTVTT